MNMGRLGGWLERKAWRSATGKEAHSQSRFVPLVQHVAYCQTNCQHSIFKMIDRCRWQRTIFEFRMDLSLHLVAVSRELAPASEGPGASFVLVNRVRPCGRLRGRPHSKSPKALWYYVYNAVIPTELDCTEASQWPGKKSRVISEISLLGLICYHLSCALASGPCPSPLCKIWGAGTHDYRN
jgi:hypothetical protein